MPVQVLVEANPTQDPDTHSIHLTDPKDVQRLVARAGQLLDDKLAQGFVINQGALEELVEEVLQTEASLRAGPSNRPSV